MASSALALLRAVTAADDPTDETDDEPAVRPATRGDCRGGARPCPWVSCRHHLYLDVSEESGSITVNHPGRELDEMSDTCSLDVAERGTALLSEVGEQLNVTLERARQIEALATKHAIEVAVALGLDWEGGR